MNTHNKLIPPFLQKLDQHLLLNHKLLWQTKIHFVLFYGLLAIVGATAFVWLYPLGTDKGLPNEEYIAGFMTAPALILLCYWAYTQYQYSIEADFGEVKPALAQYRLLIYTLVALVFSAPMLITVFGLHHRKENVISIEELKADRKALNEGRIYFNDSEFSDFHGFLHCNDFPNREVECDYDFQFFSNTDFIDSYEGISYEIIDHAIHEKEVALPFIEKYIVLTNKYGFALSPKITPKLIWQAFSKKEQPLTYGENKRIQEGLKYQLDDLRESHTAIIQEDSVYSFWLIRLSCLLLFGAVIQFLVIARLSNLIRSSVAFILLGACTLPSIEVARSLLEDSTIQSYIGSSAVFVLFLISLYFGFRKKNTAFTQASLGVAHIFAPFALIWVIAGLGINIVPLEGGLLTCFGGYQDLDLQNAIYLLLSVLFYTTFLSRLFYKKHIQLNALPT